MKNLILFLLIFLNSFLYSQSIEEYNKILKLDNLEFLNNEVRIYKKFSTSTGLELFRFYKINDGYWKAEFYETIARKLKDDKIEIRVRKSKLNSFKNLELIWIHILESDVIYLPEWEEFQYKFRSKNKEYEIIDGEISYSSTNSIILDGVTYLVKIKNNDLENEFIYHNPESYLKKYPNVDELISFQELLNLIKIEFDIFSD